MIGDKKWFSSFTPLSHKEYVTFGDDNKGKVLGTGVIKVNDFFTLNDITLFLSLSLWMLICMCFFESLIREFLIQLAIWFVVFLTLRMFFKLVSHLSNLLQSVCSLSLLSSSGSGIGD
jgi:hypothetical protein